LQIVHQIVAQYQGLQRLEISLKGGERLCPRLSIGAAPGASGRARQLLADVRLGLLAVAICTAVAWLMFPYFALANLIMVYLLGVIVVAMRCGRGPSLLAAALGVLAFDFFFVPPYLTFAVSHVEYFVTLSVMLAVGLLISTLTARLRTQADGARQREQRATALYAMS
jgi:two-component system, OmpR family, sensor histidine kinase KdpD